MKQVVTVSRVLTGCLFIFSGLIKAIDPRGLAYKMEEFYEAWSNGGFMPTLMEFLTKYSLGFAVAMITAEVAVGIALLIGWRPRFSAGLLFLLMLLFMFLTSYVLFSGKIHACGCLGDCIPLTPVQTFSKDVVLLVLAGILLFRFWYIKPLFSPAIENTVMIVATLAVIVLQYYVLDHLPLRDCLPFKVGNNILDLRKMPANAVQDKYDYKFVYEKGGARQEFAMDKLPDSTWKFVERKQVLISKGSNNVPAINDYVLYDSAKTDVTESILQTPGKYYVIYVRYLPSNINEWIQGLKNFSSQARKSSKVYFVTGDRDVLLKLLNGHGIESDGVYNADVTAIKTAARTIPTVYEMNGPVIANKWGWPYLKNFN